MNFDEESIKNIIGLNLTEDQYRDLPYVSYSMLSDIAKVGGALTVGAKRNTDINDMDGVLVGRLVDNLITENKMPENMFIVKKKPSGKAKIILNILAKNFKYLPNKEDLFHNDNLDLLDLICAKATYFKDRDARLKGLRNYEEYFKVLSTCPDNSFVISEYLYYDALKLVKILKDEYPMLINPKPYGFDRIIPQVKLLGEVNGISVKGMLDFVVIDDTNKTIHPYDLKTGSGKTEEFFHNGYLGWNYYIQSALYLLLLKEEIKRHPIYKDYEVEAFKFIYVGRLDKKTEVMRVGEMLQEDALTGFELNGKYYPGVYELLTEYKYYKDLRDNESGDNCLENKQLKNE